MVLNKHNHNDGICSIFEKSQFIRGQRDLSNCNYDSKNASCYPGFYWGNQGKMLPCPPGWFCPPDLTCRIECPSGSYCPESTLTGKNMCKPYENKPYIINNESICGGAFDLHYCKQGMYCPSPTKQLPCPQGSYCIKGSNEPTSCPLLSHCPGNISWPTSWGLSVLFISIGIALPFFLGRLYLHYKKRRKIEVDKKVEALRISYMSDPIDHLMDSDQIHHHHRMDLLSFVGDEHGLSISSRETSHNYSINIKFVNLGLSLNSRKNTSVLKGVSGTFRSGRFAAIMGPSGCGKTSLLNALANKADYGKISGDLFINGSKIKDMDMFSPVIGFVPQDDIMHRNFTVKEILMFYANMRLPADYSDTKRQLIVQHVMKTLKLYDIRHHKIGDEVDRGISGGQRKRVNIGMELVTNPSVLFCDEPTSGLDTTCSLEVVEALREISYQGVNVVAVMHQPRTEVFRLFDDVLLLVQGGRSVFAGERNAAIDYFISLGYNRCLECNPADYLIDVISGRLSPKSKNTALTDDDFVNIWENTFAHGYKNHFFEETQRSLCQLYTPRKLPGFFKQLKLFTWRSFFQLLRSPISQFLDFTLLAVSGFVLGLMFHHRTIYDTSTIALLTSLTIGMTTMLSDVRLFGNERVVYYRESSMGFNSFAYFLGKSIASIYMHVLAPLYFLGAFYALITPRASFAQIYGILYSATIACSGMAQLVSIIFNQKNMQLAGVVIVLLLNMVGGTNPSICALNDMSFIPVFFVHISYARFCIDAMVVTELNNWPSVYQFLVSKIKEDHCYEEYGTEYDVVALIAIGILCRMLAFLFMIVIVPNRAQSLRNFAKVSISFVMIFLLVISIIGAILGGAYLILSSTT